MSSANARVAVTPGQAQSSISQDTRNELLSALLSNGGINNIESNLTHNLQRSGWLHSLREYVSELFRSGECTTVDEAMAKVKAKILQDSAPKANGTTNGVNGVNGTNGNTHGDDYVNLAIPNQAIRDGIKTIKKELHKVCEITSEDADK
ncbi:hypothetical protein K491DRAFT_592276 [Lophiostoma macrostomum CBS 122681]|uniref:Uncharacterized protein n=1 Tax=Lophiostoma macrostomum CBS 122681 TaxID=1314788 RepID=A0A6A6TGK7_9PLEO|nr:hypothetical protein K491DRAFT_592276 [Lophiostoma macrostomum CBS 122681]